MLNESCSKATREMYASRVSDPHSDALRINTLRSEYFQLVPGSDASYAFTDAHSPCDIGEECDDDSCGCETH